MAPAPQPVEGSMAVARFLGQPQEGVPRPNTISLGTLIDFIVQRTYHDLTVLSELLPRKSDMERKIEIYNFAARTRQLFIRLIAVVKWANSVSKVEKSANIMSFLDQQNMLFIDTADKLARMSRETLVHARLPVYQIPAAVEVLTRGTYNRLPKCIRDRVVPPDPITTAEKRQTLLRLNQVIQHRLVTCNLVPQMKNLKIKDGRVTFEVKNEFTLSLTVMGDEPELPWHLLGLEILVEDKETGDGKPMVHPMQIQFLHEFVQRRLVQVANPLGHVYDCLHFFCQSLQLEVLYTQALRLSFERLDENIFVEDYAPGSRITVSYWRKLTSRDKGELAYRLTVQAEGSQASNQLVVVHVPSLGAKETAEVAERALRSDHLSIERLIVHAIHLRSIMRLTDVKHELQPYLKDVDFNLQGTPAILTVPVLTPCLRAEQIHITVDTYTGLLRCHVPKHVDCPIMPEMQAILNGDRSKLIKCLTELRYWITHRRCEKTLQHLPATACESLPFLTPPDNPIVRQGRQKVFVRLHRYPNVILVVQLREKEGVVNEMDYTFHLGFVAYQSDERDTSDEELLNKGHLVPATINTTNRGVMNSGVGGIGVSAEMPKPFMKLLKLFELDTFLLMHGPVTDVDEVPPHKRKPFNGLEGLANGAPGAVVPASGNTPSTKQQKTIYPAYFIPELAHFVAMCDEIIPFMGLGQALVRHNIPHSGIQVEPNATSLVLRILTLPKPDAAAQQAMASQVPFAAPSQPGQGAQQPGGGGHKHLPPITDQMWENLMRRVLSISIRSQVLKNNQVRNWGVEFVFYGTPLASSHPNEQGSRRTLHLPYDQVSHDFDKTVKELLVDWSRIVYLYALVYNFAEVMRNERLNLSDIVAVTSFNYMNLQFGYGPKKEMSCNIDWCTQTSAYRLNFFGSISSANSHSIMRDQLLTHLNRNFNLTHIVQILHDTYQPLSSIAKLPVIPLLGIPKTQVPVLSFCVLPQSPCIVRLLYQGLYCLEVRFRTNRLVSVRDGAYSHFDRHLIGEITPIQGLKSFLSKYVDENAVYRGRSQSEDDNPPSPLGIEDSYGGPGSVTGAGAGGSSPFLSSGMRGPQSPRDSGLRFPAPHTPPSSSNPHTPSSPHPGAGGAGAGNHPNYNLTSPPAPHMPHPSPGGLMPSSPLNPQPSPHMVHSPGPSTLYMQGHQDSPFSAMSPANTNWPGSPSMPRPSPRPGQSPEHKPSGLASGSGAAAAAMMSRVATNRSWAGSVPTLLTHEALETLCRSSPHPNRDFQSAIEISAIERFLGCVYMRRHLQRSVQTAADSLVDLKSNEPGVVLFKVDGLQCQVLLNPNHMQSLHLKVTQPPLPPTPDGKQPFQLAPDDLLVIEQFFETRVAVPPYRPNSMNGFCRALSCGPQVLKDFVQIMRLEMKPDLGGDQLKWTVQFCMRVPPSAAPIVPIGSPGLIIYRQKILFFLQITRFPYNGVEWKDSPSLILPVVYDMSTNVTQLADRREQTSQAITLASSLMRRFSEYNVQHGQCTLFPAVRDLLINLQLPNDIPPPNQVQGMGQVMGQPGMGPGGMGQPMVPAMGQGMPMNQPMGQPGMGPGGMGQPMPMNQNMGPQAMGQYIGGGGGGGGVGIGNMGAMGQGVGNMGGGMGGIGSMGGGMGGPVGQVGPIGQMGQVGPVGAVNPIGGPVLGSSPNPMMPQINQVGAPSVGQINQYPQMGQNPGSGPV